MSRALAEEVERCLDQYPHIRETLDDTAFKWLRKADPDRAVEIIEDMGMKGDVRNPSAFVSIACSQYLRKRGKESDVDDVLDAYPSLVDSLDDVALTKLKEANPARAVEIIEDMAAKGDIRNPSAFVLTALNKFPHKRGCISESAHQGTKLVDEVLSNYPAILEALDDLALQTLRQADQERAVEIVEDVAMKGDVRNPSAFVVKALKEYPYKRVRGSDVEEALEKYSSVTADLDDTAINRLREADPARAVEIIEDMAAKEDVRNPSAFVATALNKYPFKRGSPGEPPLQHQPQGSGFARQLLQPGVYASSPVAVARHHQHQQQQQQLIIQQQQILLHQQQKQLQAAALAAQQQQQKTFLTRSSKESTVVDDALARYPSVRLSLDEGAVTKLQEADPERALEIIQDVASKGNVRNPSAFIMKALADYPQRRTNALDLDGILSRYPSISSALDDAAVTRLRDADPERALEIIQDMAAKGDVRNPSAFVATALGKFPNRRGPAPAPLLTAAPILAALPLQAPRSAVPQQRMQSSVRVVDQALARYPKLSQQLDDQAIIRLRSADQGRALEIIEDVGSKDDVRNPSAFVVKALTEHPTRRGRDEPTPAFLSSGPTLGGIVSALTGALTTLVEQQQAQQAQQHQQQKRQQQQQQQPRRYQQHGTKRQRLGGHAFDSLDESAQRSLRNADSERADEILEELESKGNSIRNPSAFVAKALQQFPHARGRNHS
eukprot:TRINITY_DN11154_c2_g1_i1.p1 TRINITY_DN11154_c2_g1~~TRINITY_DN11154_c2_g1_i1.p1  ORF type:complete len:746 (-),score=173.30 TRINITY_DN11154_c2_g1_i1:51-2225(-)